jgi:hypothetical protein
VKDYRVRYVLGAVGLTIAVVLVGLLLTASSSWPGVLTGGVFALFVQLAVFLALGVLLLPGRRLLVFALGMVARVTALAVLVLFTVRLDVPPAPALLTLVAVFLVTTVLEPVVFQLETKNLG